MNKLIIAAAVLAAPLALAPASAQDGMDAQPEIANKDWYNVVYYDFKPRKTGAALDLIKEFIAVDRELGLEPPMMIRLNTGEYDAMVIFPMRQGIAQMGWKSNPSGQKWNDAFAKRLGGREKVSEHWEKFAATIDRTSSDIGYYDRDFHAGK